MRKNILKIIIPVLVSIMFLIIAGLLFNAAQSYDYNTPNYAILMTGSVFSAMFFILFMSILAMGTYIDDI